MNEPARLIKQVVQNIEYQVNVLDRLVLADAKYEEYKKLVQAVQALQLIRDGLDKLLLCSQ